MIFFEVFLYHYILTDFYNDLSRGTVAGAGKNRGTGPGWEVGKDDTRILRQNSCVQGCMLDMAVEL